MGWKKILKEEWKPPQDWTSDELRESRQRGANRDKLEEAAQFAKDLATYLDYDKARSSKSPRGFPKNHPEWYKFEILDEGKTLDDPKVIQEIALKWGIDFNNDEVLNIFMLEMKSYGYDFGE
jgi:hypothetical protein